jgi:hypothetical protein
MRQLQHCPPEKRREDWNSKYYEEQQKDVAHIPEKRRFFHNIRLRFI